MRFALHMMKALLYIGAGAAVGGTVVWILTLRDAVLDLRRRVKELEATIKRMQGDGK
jgi:hypothetical protein